MDSAAVDLRAAPLLGEGWELRLLTGRAAGTVLVVPRTGALLGTAGECELVLPDDGIAPRHLRLQELPDGRLGYVHLGGRWPTLLDGEPRASGALSEGSQLQIGPVLLIAARRTLTVPPGAPPGEEDEPPLAPGTVLAERYRIHAMVGRGGMGTVYRAEHLALGNTVAVKVLRAAHGARTDIVRRFQREAVAASQIRHPGIVQVSDFGRTPDGRFYLAMEFVDGETLARRLSRAGPLAPVEAITLVGALARALGAAHARGIYHRDIKPENVLLASDGTTKLADFGIARLAEGPRDARETAAGLIFGTPHYMSPEQAAGQRQDGRSDVYALGVLLYELLSGGPPFLGASPTHVLAAHLLSPVPRLPPEGPQGPLSATLADLVERMMAKDAGDRPGSMAEVEAALEAVLAGEALPPPRSRVPAWRRSRWVGLGAAAAVVALALGAIWLREHRSAGARAASTPVVALTPERAIPAGAGRLASEMDAPVGPESRTASESPAGPGRSSGPAPAIEPRPDRPAPVQVGVRSSPPGARVTLHGRVLGTTPLSVRLPPERTVLLVFEADGRQSIAERVKARPGLVVTAHLPPAPLAPGLEDLKASPY